MRALFLGEGSWRGPAVYLGAVLKSMGAEFDRVEDESPVPASFLRRSYQVYILSDYRHSNFSSVAERHLRRRVSEGAGLLMIGGWASFTGLVGGYSKSLVEELLPVRCLIPDDRVNYPTGSLVVKSRNGHPMLQGLDWTKPPTVCGYHRVRAKPHAETLLELRDLKASGGRLCWGSPHPLLVTGRAGRGRTAAFMTDCAPHWCGGLVDWGQKRQTIRVVPGVSVEVGNSYLRFFSQLIRWVASPA